MLHVLSPAIRLHMLSSAINNVYLPSGAYKVFNGAIWDAGSTCEYVLVDKYIWCKSVKYVVRVNIVLETDTYCVLQDGVIVVICVINPISIREI